MFVRAKKSGDYEYLQIVENQRIDGKVRQQVVATLGRLDLLQATGKVDAILSSCARFAQKVSILDAHKRGTLPAAKTIKIGPTVCPNLADISFTDMNAVRYFMGANSASIANIAGMEIPQAMPRITMGNIITQMFGTNGIKTKAGVKRTKPNFIRLLSEKDLANLPICEEVIAEVKYIVKTIRPIVKEDALKEFASNSGKYVRKAP